VPLSILRALLSFLRSEDAPLGLDWQAKTRVEAHSVLVAMRTEIVHEFVKTFQLEVPHDYFFELAEAELGSGRYPEAAICIVNSGLVSRFDCRDLCLNLVDVNRVHECKLLLNLAEHLRRPVIEALTSPKHAKTATKLVIDFGLDPESFPELMRIVARNSAIFFISKLFKREDHPEFAPLQKVEDVLAGQPLMLAFLVEELCRHADK